MKFVVWIACTLGFAASLAVVRGEVRPASNGLSPGSVRSAPVAVADSGLRPGAVAGCGDGVPDAGEECDDGNNDEGDGCDATCQNECGDDVQEWTRIATLDLGKSVSVSGDTVVVRDRVFERNAGGIDAWGQVAELTASDEPSHDGFGNSVSVSGDTLVVGAFLDDESGLDSGAAYVFERDAGGVGAWGQVAKLTASDSVSGAGFGFSVSLDGDRVVVGAFLDDGTGSRSGSAYVFDRDAGGTAAWGQVAKLTASDAGANDFFGASVSVSGDTLFVANRRYSATESVYVFERNAGGADAWGQVARLTASNAAADSRFGWSVSASGDTVVVGAHHDDEAGSASGSAYVFSRNAGGADAWGQVAKLSASDAAPNDWFGWSISISGDRMVVGARNDDEGVSTATGSVYVFDRDEGGADVWGQVAKLPGSDPAGRSRFGNAVSVNGDTVVVGADNDHAHPEGATYILTLGCITCGDGVQEAPEICDEGTANSDTVADACRTDCTPPVCGDGVTDSGEECDEGTANSDALPDTCRTDCTLPVCGDGVTDTAFGEVCDYGAVNSDTLPGVCRTDCTLPTCGDGVTDSGEQCDDGNTGDGDGCDATCELQTCGDGIVNDGCGWDRVAKLVALDAAVGDRFGSSVSVSGDTAVVGASGGDDSAFVFERNVGGADAWGQVAKLTASGADFGSSVSVGGDTIVVGARFENVAGVWSGAAYVFERNAGGVDAWGQVAKLVASDAAWNHFFGATVAVSGDTVVVGSERIDQGVGGSHSGAAYVFERGAGAWGQVAKLTVSDGAFDDYFGWSVSISGDTIVVGAHRNRYADVRPGAAYVFERDRGGPRAWGRSAKLTASDAATGDSFGVSVSVGGDTIVVGASGDDDAGSFSGSAYVFERDLGGTDGWGQVAKLTASDAAAGDNFGWASISGDTIVVGVASDDDAGSQSGSAYVFKRNIGGADAWEQVAKLTVSDAAGGDGFGGGISVSGDTIVAGASGDDDAGSSSGSAYILTLACEECDDGNSADGDGCSSTCQIDMNLIASGGFEQRVPWRFFTDGMGMFRVVGEEGVVTIGNSGSNTQLFQRFGGLVAGTYQLDFDVKSSSVTRARTILVNETDLSWIAQAGFRARPAWSHVTSTLEVPADVPPGMTTTRLSFYMPGVPNGTILHFDNVVLKRVGPD